MQIHDILFLSRVRVLFSRYCLLVLVAALVFTSLGCNMLPDDIDKSYGGGKFAKKAAFRDDFSPGWEENQKSWRVATWRQNHTQMDPERCKTNGAGQMEQTVKAGLPALGGSMQTGIEFPYGRWIARVKPSSVPGVLNSMFTVDWDDLTTPEDEHDGKKFEVDIEFLTYTFKPDSAHVHLAIHLPGHSNLFVTEAPLDFNPSDDFHVMGFDILPDSVTWHVDGKELSHFDRPEGLEFPDQYEFFFNSWTTKPSGWIKGPAKEDATYQIDWVRFYPLVD